MRLVRAGGGEIAVSDCVSFLGVAFDKGSHPIVETMRELIDDPHLPYSRTTLGQHHERFQPQTMRELFFPGEGGDAVAQLDDWPVRRSLYRYVWDISGDQLRDALSSPRRDTNYSFGPATAEDGRGDLDRIKKVLTAVRHDYRPADFPPVTGYFLSRGQDVRFVIGSGNHRVAALVALGMSHIRVVLHSHPAVVSAEELATWTRPHGGIYDPQCAYALHDRMLSGSSGWTMSSRPRHLTD